MSSTIKFHPPFGSYQKCLAHKDSVTVKECGPCGRHSYLDPQCKVALVTGGTSGIGYAAANELLKSGLYRVVLTGNVPEQGVQAVKTLEAQHGQSSACFINMNVNCPKQFADVFREMHLRFGGVDIVFNNAGVMEDNRWEHSIDTNLKAVIRGTLLAFENMGRQKNRGGVVINNADAVGLTQFAQAPMYAASKYGVIGASKSLGADYHYKATGVRVVALCPGWTDTAMIKSAVGKQYKKEWGAAAVQAIGAKTQNAQVCGRAVLFLTRYADPGSVWSIVDSQLSRIEWPPLNMISEKVAIL